MSKINKKEQLFKIIMASILIALNVILERFLAYSVWNTTISFGFVTVAFAACYLGTPYAMAVAAFGDVIGSVIKPFGPYFVGFTVTNLIVGLILGLFLSKKVNFIRVSLAVFLNSLICSLFLNTMFVAILYRGGVAAFWTVLVTRLPSTALLTSVQIIVIYLLFRKNSYIDRTLHKVINNKAI